MFKEVKIHPFSASYSPFFSSSHETSIAHAIIPFFFILTMHMSLWPRHMNMHFTLTLGMVVTDI
jgi:hypothetical protein